MNYDNDLKLLTYSTNPVTFITDALGLEVKWFHKEWLDMFEDNTYIALLAPRGHGKSTIVASYLLWRILRDPTIRILQVTINQDKANEMMSFIQSNLANNENIVKIWGDMKNPNDWSKSSIRVINRGKPGQIHKEPTLQVLGVTSSMVGGHYDLIILDDITDGKNSRTEYRRQDLVRWYNMTLLPMLEPTGKIISIGTKWHESDIHSFFRKQSRYKTRKYKAVIFEPDEEQVKTMKPQVLWPDRFSYDKLMEIKEQAGTVGFYMQYQNEVVSDEDAIIKWEWIEKSKLGYEKPDRPYQVFMGVDLASKGEDTDYFTISVIAIKDGFVYLIDGYRNKHTMKNQFKWILHYDDKWRPIRIGIDSAAQQKMITDQLIEDNPTIPIIPVKPSIVNDRMSRVQRLSVLYETNRIYMNPSLNAYADELAMFPRGAHDDAIDSLSFAIQAARLEEDEHHVDWDRMANLIYVGERKERPHVSRRAQSYNVIKV